MLAKIGLVEILLFLILAVFVIFWRLTRRKK